MGIGLSIWYILPRLIESIAGRVSKPMMLLTDHDVGARHVQLGDGIVERKWRPKEYEKPHT